MKKELFLQISATLVKGVKYNLEKQSVELNLSLIRSSLKKTGINNDVSQRIENACKLIAKDICYSIKNDSTSFYGMSSNLHSELESISRDIGSTGYLQSTMYARSSLSKSINSCDLEDSFRKQIEAKVEAVYSGMQKDDMKSLISGLNSLKEISISLTQYINDMKLPAWFAELFFQKINNRSVAESNLECVRSIDIDINLDDGSKQEIKEKIQQSITEAYRVKSVIEKNNELLSKIENDIDSKRSAVKNVQNKINKFLSTVADGVILKALQADNKAILTQIKSLDIAIQSTPQYFDSVEKIDEYYLSIKDSKSSVSQIFKTVLEIEKSLGVTSSTYGDKIRNIEKALDNFLSALEIEKVKIENCVSSAIPEGMLTWERSGWQSFKTFFADFSKFFIGDYHTKVYGYPEGVEELRRAIESIPDSEIKLLDNHTAEDLYVIS